MAIERTFSILKPDATARNLTGAINAMIEKAGLRIIAQKRVRMTRGAGRDILRRASRAAVLRRARRVHDLGPGGGAGAGRRERDREISRSHGRDRSRQGCRRHDPQGACEIGRREFGARFRCRPKPPPWKSRSFSPATRSSAETGGPLPSLPRSGHRMPVAAAVELRSQKPQKTSG